MTKALCCPAREMLAKGLCSSCYIKNKKNNFKDCQTTILAWELLKKERSEKALKKRKEKANVRRRGPSWRFVTLKHRYGLDEASYNQLLLEQDNRCKICQKESENLYVDHCHTSQQVRGLLCPKCNTFVGYVETSPEEILQKIKEYLNDDRPT
jgi:hypothetical protein